MLRSHAKKLAFFLLISPVAIAGSGQSKSYDSVAVLVLDRMSNVIGDMESCSFKLNSASDEIDPPYGLIKMFGEYEIYMSGPDKMLLNAHGHKGHREFIYDGHQLAYYSFDEHNYGIIPSPPTTIKTIDSVNKLYGIEFPAADFFYPAFTDDLIENSDSIRYIGITTIDGKEYFHIMAFAKDVNFQLWITNDAYTLPFRFSIVYKHQEGNPQYLASFSDWNINPRLPASMFVFLPPPGASMIRIMSKNER
jgi:hypothetical protein